MVAGGQFPALWRCVFSALAGVCAQLVSVGLFPALVQNVSLAPWGRWVRLFSSRPWLAPWGSFPGAPARLGGGYLPSVAVCHLQVFPLVQGVHEGG